jgi:hypothetical protein
MTAIADIDSGIDYETSPSLKIAGETFATHTDTPQALHMKHSQN